ncbi:MAG: DUF3592 domain-containing protein [Deltaproteobacteria bacterium]|nr:DUF3592 domain-containing protein [Deltaproteobacteria bacterium]
MAPSSIPPNPFLLLSGNQAFLERKRSKPCVGPGTVPATIVVAAVVLGLFVFPLFFLLREASLHSQLATLRKQGQRIEAVVLEQHQEGRKLGRICSFSYSFRLPAAPGGGPATTIDGQDETAAQCCTWFEDHSPEFCTPKGTHPCDRGSVMVYYDPANPKINRLDQDRPKSGLWIAAGLTGLTGTIVAVVFGMMLRGWSRLRRLGSKGQRIVGTVRSAKVARAKGNRIELVYAFVTPDGHEIEGKVKEFWDNPAGTPPPMPGAPLVVLYVDDLLHKVL